MRSTIDTLGWCLYKHVADPEEIYDHIKHLQTDPEPRAINDLANTQPSVLPLLWSNTKVQEALALSFSEKPIFLQSSDILLNYDAPGWHRDSPFRHGRHIIKRQYDWDAEAGRYDVVKSIFFASISHYAFAVVDKSHLEPVDRRAIDLMEPHGRFVTSVEQALAMHEERPGHQVLYIVPEPGDLFVFDQRLFHCGRNWRANGYEMRRAQKATIAACFGGNTLHAERFHNYWRNVRGDLKYRDMPEDFVASLGQFGFAQPSFYKSNIFDRVPGLRDEVYIKQPTATAAM